MAEPWSTEKIREAFIYDGGEAEYHDPINGARDQRRIAGEIFDTWLAALIAEKRAEWEAEQGETSGPVKYGSVPLPRPRPANYIEDGSEGIKHV